jgi:hypothetical protein
LPNVLKSFYSICFVSVISILGTLLRVQLYSTIQRFLPVTARLHARLLGRSTIPECASEIVELAPAVDRVQPSAIALPGEIHRVLGFQEDTTLAMEHER